LLRTRHVFSGNKEKALGAIHDAIRQIELILKHTHDNTHGIPTRGDLREQYKQYPHHPHLHHALNELRHAHAQLAQDKHPYGGHRDAALRDLHYAIQQIQLLLQHPHHHLHHALWELRDARKELLETKTIFGPFKDKAVLAISQATTQVELILKYTGDNTHGVPTRGDLREFYKQYPHHPHLHHALHELNHAHAQLAQDKHSYGGHRDAALRDIRYATHQIEVLLKYAKK
jgi:hypothetical protein